MTSLSSLTLLHAADLPALWDSSVRVPNTADLPILTGVEFHVIKPYQFDKDGYRFLHGVALAWHKERLYASFGHNQGGENTETEEAHFRTSDDGGKTWSTVLTIDAGHEPGMGVSHGVFLSLHGRLWAFHGAYFGTLQRVRTRAYQLDESSGAWQSKGKLYVGYSNNGGNVGRQGTGRELWNNNSAELAVIPVKSLRTD